MRSCGKGSSGNTSARAQSIELKNRSIAFSFSIGLAKEYQSSEFSIEDYLTLPNIKVIGLIRRGNDVYLAVMVAHSASLDGADRSR